MNIFLVAYADPGDSEARIMRCLNCNQSLDAASAFDEKARPSPNDLTVCLYCSHLMAFDDDLNLRPLTDAEIIECAGHAEIIKTMEITKTFRDIRERKHRGKTKERKTKDRTQDIFG